MKFIEILFSVNNNIRAMLIRRASGKRLIKCCLVEISKRPLKPYAKKMISSKMTYNLYLFKPFIIHRRFNFQMIHALESSTNFLGLLILILFERSTDAGVADIFFRRSW